MKIAVIPGDGVGPEVMRSALDVLEATGFSPDYIDIDIGYGRWRREGVPMTDDDLEAIKGCDAVLKGPVGTPPRRTDTFPSVTLRIRLALDVYANVRPSRSLPISPFQGVDMVIVRENTEDVYAGRESYVDGVATAERVITEKGSRRIVKYAFDLARRQNRKKVTCVHKANIMQKTCGLFRDVFYEVARDYPDIAAGEILVDACAHDMIMRPQSFDVLVTTNMFGDILSDEAAALVGGLGLVGSYNVGDRYALFEPVHGTAMDIAGRGVANPTGMIMAATYLLEYFGMGDRARSIIEALNVVLSGGRALTPDIGGDSTTEVFTRTLISELKKQ